MDMAPKDALTLKHIHQNDLKTHTLKVHRTTIYVIKRLKRNKVNRHKVLIFQRYLTGFVTTRPDLVTILGCNGGPSINCDEGEVVLGLVCCGVEGIGFVYNRPDHLECGICPCKVTGGGDFF